MEKLVEEFIVENYGTKMLKVMEKLRYFCILHSDVYEHNTEISEESNFNVFYKNRVIDISIVINLYEDNNTIVVFFDDKERKAFDLRGIKIKEIEEVINIFLSIDRREFERHIEELEYIEASLVGKMYDDMRGE